MNKVSIIVAAFNIEAYIGRCLDSLINQTYSNIEIIVVNDGSTDQTLSIIQSYAAKDERIRIINQSNKGLASSRLCGVNQCTGQYLLFVDGDDWIHNNTVKTVYDKAIKGDYDIVSFKYIACYDNGTTIEDWDLTSGEINTNELMRKFWMSEISHNLCTKFIRVEFFKQYQRYFLKNVSFGEDLAFTFILFINHPKVYALNKVLYYYYQRNNSLTNQVSDKLLELNVVFDFIKKELKRENQYKQYKDEMEFFIFKQGFDFYKDVMFFQNAVGKQMYLNWRSLNINIFKNKYFKNNASLKSKLANVAYQLNYDIAKISYRSLITCRKVMNKGDIL